MYSSGNAYWEDANSKILSLAMIETKEAFQNINSIVNTKGLSGVYIGPSDLGIGLSDGDLGPGMDRTEVEVIDAFNEILNDYSGFIKYVFDDLNNSSAGSSESAGQNAFGVWKPGD